MTNNSTKLMSDTESWAYETYKTQDKDAKNKIYN